MKDIISSGLPPRQPAVLPLRNVNLSAWLKLATAARHRIVRSPSSSSNQAASMLKAVNAVLSLCDVATHCLAVVSRQVIAPFVTCEVAVNHSSRLLTLAASLHEAHSDLLSPAPKLPHSTPTYSIRECASSASAPAPTRTSRRTSRHPSGSNCTAESAHRRSTSSRIGSKVEARGRRRCHRPQSPYLSQRVRIRRFVRLQVERVSRCSWYLHI